MTIASRGLNIAYLMLLLYDDSLRASKGLNDEELIQCEIEAESGDGMSKLIEFCHKCFIDHTIMDRDLKRLELEASEGNSMSADILFGYNLFFAD